MVQSVARIDIKQLYWWPESRQDLPGACCGIAGPHSKAESRMKESWYRNMEEEVAGSDSPGAADDLHCKLNTGRPTSRNPP
jgi:hypothetical protein